jgi:hypothetical protein
MPRNKGVSRRHKAGTGNKRSRSLPRAKIDSKGTSSETNIEKNCNTDAERPTNINPALLPPLAVLPIETVSTPCLKLLKPVQLLKTISALKEAAVFTTELQECASRVKEIIRDAQRTTQSVVASATATAVSNVGTSDSVGTSASPLVPRSLTYNNAIVDLEMKTSPVKQDAFTLNKKGDLRSLSASRKAKNRAVNTIVSAVQSVGNTEQQKLALRMPC